MSEKKLPHYDHNYGYSSETRVKILTETLKLFAFKGFAAVSMKDIAKAAGIKTSSIYNYYNSKDALLEDVLVQSEKRYWHYLNWLSAENAKAETLKQLVDNMINEEIIGMKDPISCFAISFILKEQHSNPSVRRYVFELFWDHSIKSMKNDFDAAIERGIIPPCDTKVIATTLLFNIIATNDMRIHEYMGFKPLVNTQEVYDGLKKLLTILLSQGQKD